jgi:hydrogenase nickel incorporation protein HypB
MCTVCGCGTGETTIEGAAKASPRQHSHADGTVHGHAHHDGQHHHHDHHHDHGHGHDHGHEHRHHEHHDGHGAAVIDFGAGPARAHAPGLSQTRMVQIEQDILAKNDAYAAANRSRFDAGGILALNVVSSPGSGKTTLLVATIELLKAQTPVAVIEGDQQTSNDAERIRATGVPALQINTGKGCHLDAHMVGHAIETLRPANGAVLFIENVGNLVCPAAFDLGEAHRVVVLSVTEGEDKPLKYPDMFASADLMLLSKVDLLPHIDFDAKACVANARKVNRRIKVIEVSAKTGTGMAAWIAWLRAARTLAFPNGETKAATI